MMDIAHKVNGAGFWLNHFRQHPSDCRCGHEFLSDSKTGIRATRKRLYHNWTSLPNRLQLIAELYAGDSTAGESFDHNCYRPATHFNHHAAFIRAAVELEHLQGISQGCFLGIENDGWIKDIQTSSA